MDGLQELEAKNWFSQDGIQKLLDLLYSKVLTGAPGIESAEELVKSYAKGGNPSEEAKQLVKYQIAKAAASGFLNGLGGALTLPVTLPASITIPLYLQMRMIVAIAIMGGVDPKEDQVKSMIYICLVGNSANTILKGVGVQIGKSLTKQALRKGLSGQVLFAVNKAVGFRLLTKFGEKGLVNLSKAIPVAGGVIGGAWDGVTTNLIGNVAIKLFIEGELSEEDLEAEQPANS